MVKATKTKAKRAKVLRMKNQARHGDVLLERVDASKLDGAKKTGAGSIVLAQGTATGHSHVISGDVKAFSDTERNVFLSVDKDGAALTHEEHATIKFGLGTYRVMRQVEFGADEAARQVAD